VIVVRDLVKQYGTRRALDGVTLDVAAGERVALVGPNGSGKTTLLRCLLGLVRGEGSVRIGGHDPWSDHLAAQKLVAYVPQRAPSLQVPVSEVRDLWASVRPEAAPQLPACARALGFDVDGYARLRFSELSGGMQQKLLVAMALATGAPVLLCDEPTANLDPDARATFLGLLQRRTPKPCLVVSSHRLAEIRRLVDRVVVMAEGRVVFNDCIETFLADPRLAAAAGVHDG
jgi:ABC-2 type transport system ATP-binding protein